jgi:dihydroorotase
MKICIKNGRIIDPQSGMDVVGDICINGALIESIGQNSGAFAADLTVDAQTHWVLPGLVDLSVRVMEPGLEHEGMLASELLACVAGGVTSLVCPPDTDPTLDEPGLVEMLKFRADQLQLSRLFPLGALTKSLGGETLSEMLALTQAGCVGFSQADQAVKDTHVLQRAFTYASTFGYTVWLHPSDYYLGRGVAASGALALRMGLSTVPVASETISLNTIMALMRGSGARVHLSRLSSAHGVELVKAAKAEGLPLTCDVSINSLHLTEMDLGYFDARARVTPALRQSKDRDALRLGLLHGVIDTLVSDHNPVPGDLKTLPFAQSTPGASGVELLLSLAYKWCKEMGLNEVQGLQVVTSKPGSILNQALTLHQEHTPNFAPGELRVGALADICIFDPHETWSVSPSELKSQGKHTPFDFEMSGSAMTGRVKKTFVKGRLVYSD